MQLGKHWYADHLPSWHTATIDSLFSESF